MSLDELRKHRDHKFGEHYAWCGYCWLEGEATAGEPGGGGYDYYVPLSTSFTRAVDMTEEEVHASHEAALAPRDMSRTDRRYLAMDDMTRHMYDLGRSGSGGEYAEEPAYHNPFALTGAIGTLFPCPRPLSTSMSPSRDYQIHRQWIMDAMLSLSIRDPLPLCIITGI